MKVTAVLFVLSCSFPLVAQFGPPPDASRGFGLGAPFLHQETVTGLPFTATVTNTRVQQLAGGNTIQRTLTGQMGRDSLGRTFEIQTIKDGPLSPGTTRTIIFITDPVGGYSYVLNPADNTATRRPFHSGNAFRAGNEARGPRQQPQSTTADLGVDSSTGVAAQGKRTSHTIAAGEIGNAAAITVTSDRWYSGELKLVVKSVRDDPRFGQSTYALSNIVRGEPDPSNFQIPGNYKIVDAPARQFNRPEPGKQ